MTKPKIKKICKHCGKSFEVYPCQKDIAQYCSLSCMASNRTGKKAANWQGGKVELRCKFCQNKFLVDQWRKNSAIYCSRSCSASDKKGKDALNWQGGPVKRTCIYCGRNFEVKKARTKKGTGKYCSRECHDKARIKRTPVPCPTCGRLRQLRDSEINRGRVFCNMRCYRLHKPTSIELAIQNKLLELDIKFIPEKRFGRWSVDIYVPLANLAIECDGTYWHRLSEIQERDKRKDAYLSQKGIVVIRFSEDEIRNHLESCVQKIVNSL